MCGTGPSSDAAIAWPRWPGIFGRQATRSAPSATERRRGRRRRDTRVAARVLVRPAIPWPAPRVPEAQPAPELPWPALTVRKKQRGGSQRAESVPRRRPPRAATRRQRGGPRSSGARSPGERWPRWRATTATAVTAKRRGRASETVHARSAPRAVVSGARTAAGAAVPSATLEADAEVGTVDAVAATRTQRHGAVEEAAAAAEMDAGAIITSPSL